ncbi:transposase [Streptomyces scabiei]|uniref:transposase n=1 Tax=Streptomyces scabiei TaxID=1930 RepID=UPI001F168AA4|nr:transposase [Streptomyces scabiei]
MITAWKQERVARSATGNAGVRELRGVVNAIIWQNRTGRQWRHLPAARPARMTIDPTPPPRTPIGPPSRTWPAASAHPSPWRDTLGLAA